MDAQRLIIFALSSTRLSGTAVGFPSESQLYWSLASARWESSKFSDKLLCADTHGPALPAVVGTSQLVEDRTWGGGCLEVASWCCSRLIFEIWQSHGAISTFVVIGTSAVGDEQCFVSCDLGWASLSGPVMCTLAC